MGNNSFSNRKNPIERLNDFQDYFSKRYKLLYELRIDKYTLRFSDMENLSDSERELAISINEDEGNRNLWRDRISPLLEGVKLLARWEQEAEKDVTIIPVERPVQNDIKLQSNLQVITVKRGGNEVENSDNVDKPIRSEVAVGNMNFIIQEMEGLKKQNQKILELLENKNEQAPAVDDRDKYYLSIKDIDERRAIMRTKGNMKSQAIKEWEELHGLPFCSKHGIDESINRGKDKLHIPKKTRKQNNSKPKK